MRRMTQPVALKLSIRPDGTEKARWLFIRNFSLPDCSSDPGGNADTVRAGSPIGRMRKFHLLQGLDRLTRIDAANESRLVSIMDEDLFDYPLVYAVEPGRWQFTHEEAARLRDYLLRGGFLWVDDFHGSSEWSGFAAGLKQIFPDRRIVDIPQTDSVFHTVFDIQELEQIPGIMAAMQGVTFERDGYTPHWRGIYDDDHRLLVLINHNMDLGDAWEHADVPEYALRYTNQAYQHAINTIVYAMTH